MLYKTQKLNTNKCLIDPGTRPISATVHGKAGLSSCFHSDSDTDNNRWGEDSNSNVDNDRKGEERQWRGDGWK